MKTNKIPLFVALTFLSAAVSAAIVSVFLYFVPFSGGALEKQHSLPTVTEYADSMLGIPARVHRPNNAFLKPFSPKWAGIRVRYTEPVFSLSQPELIWVPEIVDGKYLLRWQTSSQGKPGLGGIFPGNELELIDNNLYDFGVGTLFVKVKSLATNLTGYALLETIIGETEVSGSDLSVVKDKKRYGLTTTVDINGMKIYALKIPDDRSNIKRYTDIFNDPTRYASDLSGGTAGGVHPVFAISAAYTLLLQAFRTETTSQERERAIAAVRVFADKYLEAQKVVIAPGVVSWPYRIDWTMNWGIKLSPPWYSGYANSNAAALYAILYRHTKDDRYRRLAVESAAFLSRPMDNGGAEYDISGFKYPAEYVYPSPPMPNVRVLDGELIAVTALFNAARLLGDSEMLRVSHRQMASLAVGLDYYRQKNGNIYFAFYIEELPETYKWQVWSNLQLLAFIAKDMRFAEAAEAMAPNIPKQWCELNGC